MHQLLTLSVRDSKFYENNYSDAFYHVFLFDGRGKAFVALAEYPFAGKTVLFTSPYQNIQIIGEDDFKIQNLAFHGDFYCIEYHKKEVACNGLLFNNIYLHPIFSLDDDSFAELCDILQKLSAVNDSDSFSDAVQRSYLQLMLAISSREKMKILEDSNQPVQDFDQLKTFQQLVEENYISERSVAFYAEQLHISANTLSKKIKSEFRKSPSQIIQERVILESKKRIHLTRKSIKEIAAELHFEDEYYFSRYFKKHTGVSPVKFREQVGISVVADL